MSAVTLKATLFLLFAVTAQASDATVASLCTEALSLAMGKVNKRRTLVDFRD